jgi:YbgC/YbaW family acyl-CoA thioester hydrolase
MCCSRAAKRGFLRGVNEPFAQPDASLLPTIEIEYQVMFFDTDCGGVVHNLAYLRMIETARTMLAEQIGLGMVEMAERGIYPVLLRTEADYRRPAKLSDKLIIRGRMDRVERARFWCAFEVVRPADDVLMVTCRQSLALVQMPVGKPLRLPEEWATRFAHLRGK